MIETVLGAYMEWVARIWAPRINLPILHHHTILPTFLARRLLIGLLLLLQLFHLDGTMLSTFMKRVAGIRALRIRLLAAAGLDTAIFGGGGGATGVAGEEGNGGLAALRRAAAFDHLGEAVVGADVEGVGRVGAPGIHLLAFPVRGALTQEDVEGEAAGAGAAGPVAAARPGLQVAVAVRPPVLAPEARRQRGRLGRRGRDGAVVGAAVEGVVGVGAVRVDRLLPRPSRSVAVRPCPVLRRGLARRGGDGAVLRAAVEGVGGVGAGRVDRPPSGVLGHRMPAGRNLLLHLRQQPTAASVEQRDS